MLGGCAAERLSLGLQKSHNFLVSRNGLPAWCFPISLPVRKYFNVKLIKLGTSDYSGVQIKYQHIRDLLYQIIFFIANLDFKS